jgi:UDP-N-acetylmuramyl pentapeptide phosphotransferase/UDP-N-acetylglucosamine-1-phosphate transferase
MRPLGVAGVAAAVTAAARRALDAALGTDDPRWTRTNHRGESISLLEGPAVAAGLAAGALAAGGRAGAAGALAVAGGAAFGLVDDLSEDASRVRKGLRGHLGALARGELTTGGLKVLGIGATSLVAAAVALGSDRRRSASALGHLVDVGVAGALIAGTANLVNLLDLRPGRAAKASVIAAAPALLHPTAAPVAAGAIGAAAAGLPGDLAERDMLGDGGANALGALVGTAAVLAAPRPVRAALLAGVVGLTVASERVSFTQVIARTPVLREIDAWGRRPAPGPTPAP